MIKKLKNEKGSAMQVAIILILLVGICGSAITSMVINQTKFNMKNSQNTELKYETETGTEETIGKFIEEIRVEGEKNTVTDFDILQLYVQLADILVGSNGIVDTTINNILEKMGDGTVKKSDMEMLVVKLGEVMETAGGSNPDAKELIGIAKGYAQFFADNFFNKVTGEIDLSGIGYIQCKDFVLQITNNLAIKKFTSGNGANTTTYDGNVGVIYRDVTLNNSKYNLSKNIDGIYNVFNKNKNVTNKINELKNKLTEDSIKLWAKSNVANVISDIKSTNHKESIVNETVNIDKGGYLDEKGLKQYYSVTGTGKVNLRTTVKQRLKIVEQEIDMLLQWLNFMDELDPDNTPGEGTVTNHLIVSAPKAVSILGVDSKLKEGIITSYNIDSDKVKLLPDDNSGKYKFEIIKTGLNTKIVLNLKVESKVQDEIKGEYTIEANIAVKVHSILSKDDYKIDYEVIDWKKK